MNRSVGCCREPVRSDEESWPVHVGWLANCNSYRETVLGHHTTLIVLEGCDKHLGRRSSAGKQFTDCV